MERKKYVCKNCKDEVEEITKALTDTGLCTKCYTAQTVSTMNTVLKPKKKVENSVKQAEASSTETVNTSKEVTTATVDTAKEVPTTTINAPEKATPSAIGKKIKEIRISKNLRQSDIAKEANVSKSTIVRIESGAKQADDGTLSSIVKALGVTETALGVKI